MTTSEAQRATSGIVRATLSARLGRMLRPPRRAIPTWPGLFALAAPTFLGLAAVTATNNLLFLILGATLGAIVLSGILSERNIRAIRVQVRPLGAAYAGRAAHLEIRFRRPRASSPAFDLRFHETSGALFQLRRRKVPPQTRLDVHFPVLEGTSGVVVGERIFATRGRARLALCELSTRFPFGLLVKSMDIQPSVEVWVRPREVPRPSVLTRPPRSPGSGESTLRRGVGIDIYGLRERVERDPIHRVHALRSLALGRAVVLEMSGLDRPTAELGVATDRAADPQALERALEIAQAALRAWVSEGFLVGLTTYQRRFLPGQSDLEVLLDHLAEVSPSERPPHPGHPPAWLVPRGALPPPSGRLLRVGPDGLAENSP